MAVIESLHGWKWLFQNALGWWDFTFLSRKKSNIPLSYDSVQFGCDEQKSDDVDECVRRNGWDHRAIVGWRMSQFGCDAMPQKRSDGLDECVRGNGWDDRAMDGWEMAALARAFLAAMPTLRFVCPALASCVRPISGFCREERLNLCRSAVDSCPPGNKDSIGMQVASFS